MPIDLPTDLDALFGPLPPMGAGDDPFLELCILECLDPKKGDIQTGSRLFEDVIERRAESGQQAATAFVAQCPTSAHLGKTLGAIQHRTRSGAVVPVIVIEAHGFWDDAGGGFTLPDGHEERWPQFFARLVPINVGCRNRLNLFLATCEGASGLLAVHPNRGRAPLRLAIAPQRTITQAEVEHATTTFFDAFLASHSFAASFESMQQALRDDVADPQSPAFLMRTCDWLYDYHVGRLPWSSRSKIEGRAGALLDTMRGSGQVTDANVNAERRRVKEGLARMYRALTTSRRDFFLMIDLYPELEKDFGRKVQPRD